MNTATASARASRDAPPEPSGAMPSENGAKSIIELEAEISELAGHLNAANYRRMDYSIATEILLSQSRRPRNVPAGTRTASMNS